MDKDYEGIQFETKQPTVKRLQVKSFFPMDFYPEATQFEKIQSVANRKSKTYHPWKLGQMAETEIEEEVIAEGMAIPDSLSRLKNLHILDLAQCQLIKFPAVLCKLDSLVELDISGNEGIRELPVSMVGLKQLKQLNISKCKMTVFPDVLHEMNPFLTVCAESVPIEVLSENFIKLWLKNPGLTSFQNFSGLNLSTLTQPPHAIFRRGAKACHNYYKALRLDNAVKHKMFNVTILGNTEAGKSSLAHTIKQRSPVLVHDRTRVVDTLEVQQDDVNLQITDFGGHDIYDITCPLFLKFTNQTAIIAVKLSEYNRDTHDALVTKWLSAVVSHLKKGSLFIVATQVDLCSSEEVESKMESLETNVSKWVDEEIVFSKKQSKDFRCLDSIQLVATSSRTMKGIRTLQGFLFKEALATTSVLPKHWSKIYSSMYDLKSTDMKFLTRKYCCDLFKKSSSFLKRLSFSENKVDQCLQFFHDTGFILWYGEQHENLKEIIFHNTTFLVSVLQGIFNHNIKSSMVFDLEKHGRYIPRRSVFDDQVKTFVQTGILGMELLQCIWESLNFNKESFESMIDVLTMLDLCYKSSSENEEKLRFPWFVLREDVENVLEKQWPTQLPLDTLQYTLTYCFCHKIPGTIYERFCVRLQHHLQPGGHTRQDWKDSVYVRQDKVQILFQRFPDQTEPKMQIHLRCPVDRLLQLQKLCLSLHTDMDKLCSEYSGLYIDSYLLSALCLCLSRIPREKAT